jgi:hypothetical protein
MPNFYSRAAILVVVLAIPNGAEGQVLPIITDRPDFTESPFAVPSGSVQIEAGFTTEVDDGATSRSGPEALVRWSPAAGVELRLQLPGYTGGGLGDGYTDTGIGAKIELGTMRDWAAGAIVSLGLPTGSDAASANTVEPELILTAGRDVGASWSLGAQASVTRHGGSDSHTTGATLVAGRTMTSRLSAFLEVAADQQPELATAAVFHAGFTFSLSPTLQLDLHGLVGLTETAPTRGLGLGFSSRLH